MLTKVQKWGNSQGMRISKKILEDAHVSVGDDVDVVVRDGVIMVTPASRVRGKYGIRELVGRMPKDYRPHETEFGAPAGKEAW
jgi:antitoxin MazE